MNYLWFPKKEIYILVRQQYSVFLWLYMDRPDCTFRKVRETGFHKHAVSPLLNSFRVWSSSSTLPCRTSPEKKMWMSSNLAQSSWMYFARILDVLLFLYVSSTYFDQGTFHHNQLEDHKVDSVHGWIAFGVVYNRYSCGRHCGIPKEAAVTSASNLSSFSK